MTLLLSCSGGGHLKQLHALLPRLPFGRQERVWVTFDTGLSRSLLAGENVVWATYAAPRDTRNILANQRQALRLVREHRFSHAVSTGSSLAVNHLPLARLYGASCHFVETAARATGPSMTGRILQRVPGVHTYCQYPAWAGGAWRYGGSVFDGFAAGAPQPLGRSVKKAVVSLGTTESYGFRRLVEALAPLLADADVLWQTGTTDVTGLPVRARATVPHAELSQAVREADLVVSHAGTGAALTAFEHGRCPVLVPRLQRHGEHVDDHQLQIATELDRRGLAVMAQVEDLTPQVLERAAATRVVTVADPPMLQLAD